MKLTYGYKWFRAKKRLTETWDQSRAKECHEKRQLYAVVVGEMSSPLCFVEFNNDYIGVGHLDELLREHLSYTFDEVEPGRLFLKQAICREFEEGSDKVKGATTYHFKTDGNVTVEKADLLANTRSVAETRADVAGNWETYPAFGQYQSIVRVNR